MFLRPVLGPRESGEYISLHSSQVKIKDDGIDRIVKKIVDSLERCPHEISIHRWRTHELLPQTRDEFALNWIFLSDLLNFCFWCPSGKEYVVHYKGQNRTGYWSLCAALWRAIDEGYDMTNPEFYSAVDETTLRKILRSDSDYDMPKFLERHHLMHTDGRILIKNYGGSFLNVIKACEASAARLVKILTNEFSSFSDQVKYRDVEVSFYKRAQILVADVWSCFGGEGYGKFNDINTITAFADYRVPQVLNWFGALEYSRELLDLLQKDVTFNKPTDGSTFTYGDTWEVEIRGCTIHCIELIVKKVNKLLQGKANLSHYNVNPITVDEYLWDMRREKAEELKKIPYHRTECIYY